jgi:hypothetical protein
MRVVLADRTLLGPVVEVDDGKYQFIVICGRSDYDKAQIDTISCGQPLLLEATRAALIDGMNAAKDCRGMSYHSDELELLQAAATVWPQQFASILAAAEVQEAGGSRA